jgi:hypothetical protein
MGSKTSTSSSSGGGGGGGSNNNNNNNQTNKIVKQVKKDIGLTAVGGIGGPNMGYVATRDPKTGGKISNPQMYGEAASTAAKKRMAEAGMGTYNPEKDSFQNVVGNQIISSTGMMGTSMGSGENTIMGQIPISKQMFESQKKLKMMALLPLSVLAPFPVSTVLGLGAQEARKASYDNYVNSFNQGGLIRETSSTSYAAKSNRDTSDAKIQDTKAQAEASESATVEAANLRKQAIARNQAALKGKRQFFSGTTKLIKGAMQ